VICIILIGGCKKKDDTTNPDPTPVTVTDKDGNVYHSVTIGTQVWMVENLKTTKYNDGTAIPLVEDFTTWYNLTTPGYCWYNNDAATYKDPYGALYNYHVVSTGKLAPAGWHVPSKTEWSTLIAYLGGTTVAGGKLKEMGTTHWQSPNTGATNESGFTAFPGGARNLSYPVESYNGIGKSGMWWSTTEESTASYYYMNLSFGSNEASLYNNVRPTGLSVRCIRD
jgi:uncharacterized protein (TIGR02145 family)